LPIYRIQKEAKRTIKYTPDQFTSRGQQSQTVPIPELEIPIPVWQFRFLIGGLARWLFN
jgi:hypothetical protein